MSHSRARYLVEYAGIRLALALADTLPIGLQLSLARGVGSAAYGGLTERRRIAEANILRAGITDDPNEARRIAKASFQHFAKLGVETLRYSRRATTEDWASYLDLQIPEATEALLQDPKAGMLLVSAHLGNWEVAGQALSFRKPVVAIARTMNNPYAQRLLESRNFRMNMEIIPRHRKGMGRFLVNSMRAGKALAIMFDQHARTHGRAIEFFGRPASTHTTPAVMHLATHRPIVMGTAVRTGSMTFRILLSEPIVHPRTPDREGDIAAILTDLNQRLETWIRQTPEQYLWAHRRWRD